VERYTNTGRDSWTARSGYRYVSDQSARFVRPEGEPSFLAGFCTIALTLVVVVMAVAAFTYGA